jgi:beta-alanine--pyruvate transaminase
LGLAAGIDLEPDPKSAGRRGYDLLTHAFAKEDLVLRVGGDTLALAPALIVTESEIGRMVDGVRRALNALS